MEQELKATKVHCNACAGERNHRVLYETSRSWTTEMAEDYESCESEHVLLAECLGCENWTMIDTYSIDGNEMVSQYPPKTIRKLPHWHSDFFLAEPIDNPVKFGLLKEIYIALKSESLRLAILGIRALIDQMMLEKIGDAGTFKEKVAAFEAQGFISRVQSATLMPVIDAGSASMHRGHLPTRDDVLHCLDVVENLLLANYIHPARSSSLKAPPRPPKSTKPMK